MPYHVDWFLLPEGSLLESVIKWEKESKVGVLQDHLRERERVIGKLCSAINAHSFISVELELVLGAFVCL